MAEVVKRVNECVDQMLTSESRVRFKDALEEVCMQMAKAWMGLQRYREKIGLRFRYKPGEEELWRPLPLPEIPGSQHRPNGNESSSVATNGGRRASKPHAKAQ